VLERLAAGATEVRFALGEIGVLMENARGRLAVTHPTRSLPYPVGADRC
jgi:hypothetical protein